MENGYSPEIKKMENNLRTVQRLGVSKVLLISIAYVWSLFLVNIIIIAGIAYLFGLAIYSPILIGISVLVFTIVTASDLYQLYNGRFSLVLITWLIPIGTVAIFIAVVEKMNEIPFNPNTVPLKARKYIFLMDGQ